MHFNTFFQSLLNFLNHFTPFSCQLLVQSRYECIMHHVYLIHSRLRERRTLCLSRRAAQPWCQVWLTLRRSNKWVNNLKFRKNFASTKGARLGWFEALPSLCEAGERGAGGAECGAQLWPRGQRHHRVPGYYSIETMRSSNEKWSYTVWVWCIQGCAEDAVELIKEALVEKNLLPSESSKL